MPTSTPEYATMELPTEMTHATTSAMTPSKETQPPVTFFMADLGILMIR